MTTSKKHFFGCHAHDEVFVVKEDDTKIPSLISTSICDAEYAFCDLLFIGSHEFDAAGNIIIDSVKQEKLDFLEFNRKWLSNVTQITKNGQHVGEDMNDEDNEKIETQYTNMYDVNMDDE